MNRDQIIDIYQENLGGKSVIEILDSYFKKNRLEAEITPEYDEDGLVKVGFIINKEFYDIPIYPRGHVRTLNDGAIGGDGSILKVTPIYLDHYVNDNNKIDLQCIENVAHNIMEQRQKVFLSNPENFKVGYRGLILENKFDAPIAQQPISKTSIPNPPRAKKITQEEQTKLERDNYNLGIKNKMDKMKAHIDKDKIYNVNDIKNLIYNAGFTNAEYAGDNNRLNIKINKDRDPIEFNFNKDRDPIEFNLTLKNNEIKGSTLATMIAIGFSQSISRMEKS